MLNELCSQTENLSKTAQSLFTNHFCGSSRSMVVAVGGGRWTAVIVGGSANGKNAQRPETTIENVHWKCALLLQSPTSSAAVIRLPIYITYTVEGRRLCSMAMQK